MFRALKTHIDSNPLSLKKPEYKKLVDYYLFNQMQRDSQQGDLTCDLILGEKKINSEANIIAKSNGIISGVDEVKYFLERVGIEAEFLVSEGCEVISGDLVLKLVADAKLLLRAERTILNFLGRMSAVATHTNLCVKKLNDDSILVCPTRKTLWDILDKKACLVGGGGTHRLTASSAFMAKENHLYLLKNGDIRQLEGTFKNSTKQDYGKYCEIEVETKEEALEACKVMQFLPLGVEKVVMFDNFNVNNVKNILKDLKKDYPEIIFEASGSITLDNIVNYRSSGFDVVSLGEITHSAKNFDFSLRIVA